MAKVWISTPDGTSLVYGRIPTITDPFDAELRCLAGEIRLPLGDVTKGSIHLNLPGRKERFSPLSPEQFVYQITSAYDEIWVQRGRNSLLLLRYISGQRRSAVVSLSITDGIYSIVTAFPLERDHNFRRRKEVRIWSILK